MNYGKLPDTWIVTADMGLGHKRGVWPLSFLSSDGIILAGAPDSASPDEIKLWDRMRHAYEWISRFKKVPIVGEGLYSIFDKVQSIPSRYPDRDLSQPNFQTRVIKRALKTGICDSLIARLEANPRPLLTSFYATVIAADQANYGKIYCILCDGDISRGWVATDPKKSRIEYLAPCGNVVRRLKQYGVPDERIHLTGFPMPLELTGDESLDVLRADLGQRLQYLDPSGRFHAFNGPNVKYYLTDDCCRFRDDRVLTISFCVGGAGAQREIGVEILKSLAPSLKAGEINLNLVCGIRPEVRGYFEHAISEVLGETNSVKIIGGRGSDKDYFDNFNEALRTTDIIWTKPSELSLYCGLGIPLILAPDVGAQETMNRKWLMDVQGAIAQEDPTYTHQWLPDMLKSGKLAELAWNGFIKGRCFGTYKIVELLATGTMVRESSPLRR